MPNGIPRGGGRKYCKACFENTGKIFWMDDLGNRIKCPNCGREVQISGGRTSSRPLRSADPTRFRTGGVGIGSARRDRNLDTWETPVRRQGRRALRQTVGRFPKKPDFDVFHSENCYQIIINLPYHRDLEDVRCEVIGSALVVESLIDGFDFIQKFSLPEDVIFSSLQTNFKNGILNIRFEKK
ncbi:MAG: hypothetical protein COV69_01280 [Parcubacteria group bacterium CG11_big_fil_rev_8_21_14_0_20_39_14]|nr:MAG: hypothetical protein COV69_01280 [Parcubacteria group bacterium CG11_big_fil_rev_8_21_14_0_20_39_14]